MSQFVSLKIDVLDDVNPSVFRKSFEEFSAQNDTDEIKYTLRTRNKDERIVIDAPYARKTARVDNDVDAVIVKNGSDTTIGFKFIKNSNGKNYRVEVRGDFWRTGFKEKDFCNQIARNYMITKITNDAKINGKRIISRNVNANGDVVIQVGA